MSITHDWMIDYYKNQDVFIVAGGPSLAHFDFSRLNDKNTVVINHSYRYCKTDILVFLDRKFVNEVQALGENLYEKPFRIIAGAASGMKTGKNCTVVQIVGKVSTVPTALCGRAQTGLIAINFALIAKAKNIFLLGFDGKFSNNLGHFYSKSFKHTQDNNEIQYSKMVKCYDIYKNYKNIYNCNPDSTYYQFQKVSLDAALCGKVALI